MERFHYANMLAIDGTNTVRQLQQRCYFVSYTLTTNCCMFTYENVLFMLILPR